MAIWGVIFLALGIVAVRPNVFTFILALVVIGSRQLALGLAAHEAMHGVLFTNRAINDWVGKWICARPIWVNFDLYRIEHFEHHRHLGTDGDPDLGIKSRFPMRRSKWAIALLMYASGIMIWKLFRRRLRMDLGYTTYSVTTNSRPIPPETYRGGERFWLGLKNMTPPVLSLVVLTSLLWALGFPEGVLIYLLAFYTTFPIFFNILMVSQHTETPADGPVIGNVRTIGLNPVVNWLFFPMNSNLHVEHHALMTIPSYKLGQLNRELRKRNLFNPEQLNSGLLATMKRYLN